MIIKGSQGRNLEAEAGAEPMESCHVLASYTWIVENVLQTCLPPSIKRQFLHWGSFLSNDSWQLVSSRNKTYQHIVFLYFLVHHRDKVQISVLLRKGTLCKICHILFLTLLFILVSNFQIPSQPTLHQTCCLGPHILNTLGR